MKDTYLEKGTKEKVDLILQCYKDGDCLVQIAKKTVSSQNTVKKVLLGFGIDYVKLFKQAEQDRKSKALELYKQGKSQVEIGKVCKITRKSLRTWIKEDDSIFNRTRASQVILEHGGFNEHAFENLEDEEVQYWIGFIYADGHVSKGNRGNTVAIGLKSSDYEHLVKFSKFLGSKRIPRITKQGQGTVISFGSIILSNSLKKLGFDNNKSYSAHPPEELKNSRHFWRGVVDGDGCLGLVKSKWKVLHLCGTLKTIDGFIEFNQPNTKTSRKAQGKELFQVAFYKEALQVADLLYKDSKVYLDRKYKIYKDWITDNNIGL